MNDIGERITRIQRLRWKYIWNRSEQHKKKYQTGTRPLMMVKTDSSFKRIQFYRRHTDSSIVILARNQTKDSWTWNLAVPGSGTGRRMRVDDAAQREARTREKAVAAGDHGGAVNTRHQNREARRQDRVQWRRVSRCLIPVALWNFR